MPLGSSAGFDTVRSDAPANAEISRLKAAMLGCRRCPALVKCRSRVVPGDGDAPADAMFLGIAPGRFGGDRTGVPFCGDRSGEILRRMIASAGLGRVFITNLVRCNPRDVRGRNRNPSAAEIANCRPHLDAEIALVRPRVIACLGRMAWRYMGGSGAQLDPRRPVAIRRFGAFVYPMYHPGYVVRGIYSERSYARDFTRLRAFASSLETAPRLLPLNDDGGRGTGRPSRMPQAASGVID